MMEAPNMSPWFNWFKSKKTKTPKVEEKPKNEPTAEPQKPVAVEEKPKKGQKKKPKKGGRRQ
jgi:hypothetical protein